MNNFTGNYSSSASYIFKEQKNKNSLLFSLYIENVRDCQKGFILKFVVVFFKAKYSVAKERNNI